MPRAARREQLPAHPLHPRNRGCKSRRARDWSGMLRKEQATLNSYGWVDRARGVVRIPIDREMQLIAERGFPAAKAQRGNAK